MSVDPEKMHDLSKASIVVTECYFLNKKPRICNWIIFLKACKKVQQNDQLKVPNNFVFYCKPLICCIFSITHSIDLMIQNI